MARPDAQTGTSASPLLLHAHPTDNEERWTIQKMCDRIDTGTIPPGNKPSRGCQRQTFTHVGALCYQVFRHRFPLCIMAMGEEDSRRLSLNHNTQTDPNGLQACR